MGTLEIHPSQGGADAEIFAQELANALSKHSNKPVVQEGKVLSLHRL